MINYWREGVRVCPTCPAQEQTHAYIHTWCSLQTKHLESFDIRTLCVGRKQNPNDSTKQSLVRNWPIWRHNTKIKGHSRLRMRECSLYWSYQKRLSTNKYKNKFKASFRLYTQNNQASRKAESDATEPESGRFYAQEHQEQRCVKGRRETGKRLRGSDELKFNKKLLVAQKCRFFPNQNAS